MDAGPRERTTPGLAQGARLVRRGLGRDRRVVDSHQRLRLADGLAGAEVGRPAGRTRRHCWACSLRQAPAASLSDRAVARCGHADGARGCGRRLSDVRPGPLQLHLLMTTATMFACPGCGAETVGGAPRCESCRIRLTGEVAMQLWRLDQQLASLRERRQVLVDLLRRDDEPAVARPTIIVGPAAGTETRRLLLVLGVICVVAALSAATALIWPALGPGGQTTILGLVTVALLVGAPRLGRLPATAEAIATIGLAATVVDAVAGRRLVATGMGGPASHAYWVSATAVATLMLAAVASRARWLHAPAVGAVAGSFAFTVALVQPNTATAYALVGLFGVVLGVGIAWLAPSAPMSPVAVRVTALAGAGVFAVVTAAASLQAAVERAPALWCGVALGAGTLVTRTRWASVAGGVFAGFLLALAPVVPVDHAPLMVAGVAAAVLLASWLPLRAGGAVSEWASSGRDVVVGVASICGAASLLTMQLSAAEGDQLVRGAAGLMLLDI